MEIVKARDASTHVPLTQIPGHEVKRWEDAFLGKSSFQGETYAVLLTRRDDPSKKAYGALDVYPFRVSIDIPLTDHTPEGLLIQKAYGTTFFGAVDPEKYRAFATDEFNRDAVLAFLNRKRAGVSPSETPDWFYKTFGVKHLEPYGSVFIGSHGVLRTHGYNHYATIESMTRQDATEEVTIQSAIDFAQVTQRAIRHISINPLPVDAYLNELQSTLKFLPRDWQF